MIADVVNWVTREFGVVSNPGWRIGMYKDWIISRLPSDIPAAVIDYVTRQIDANFGGYISGLQFWAFGERGPDKLLYEAKDEDDLKLWMSREAARSIAQRMELIGRAEEENRWRYVQDHVENGTWRYRENQRYHYNAIHDFRKFWMEYELRLLRPVFPTAQWLQRVEYYENCMNKSFPVKHWSYDTKALCFREVSDSKETDIYGVQQPAEGSVMQGGRSE